LHHCEANQLQNVSKERIALQIRDFEALCGFCTLSEISAELQEKPELCACVGDAHATALAAALRSDEVAQRAALQSAFTALMTCDARHCALCAQRLHNRLQSTDAGSHSDKDCLFLRIFAQFPGDVGTLAVFFLNHLKLEPGEAIYLAANEPHAYLSGELIEAMASSDNVIRAGLTPKLRDTQVLLLPDLNC
jgi:mannose-6-phosphate isomerase